MPTPPRVWKEKRCADCKRLLGRTSGAGGDVFEVKCKCGRIVVVVADGK